MSRHFAAPGARHGMGGLRPRSCTASCGVHRVSGRPEALKRRDHDIPPHSLLRWYPVHPSPDRSRSRRFAARTLLILAALAPLPPRPATGGRPAPRTTPATPIFPPPLSAVPLTPDTDTLRVGQQQQFTAVAYDTAGQPVAGAGFVWSSANTGVFTVTPNGKVT